MDDLKELLDAATPGPWIFDEENVGKSGEWCWQLRTEYGGTPVYVEISNRFNRDVRHEATARLIAMAPDLAAEVLRLRAEVERLRKALTPSCDTKAAYMGEIHCDCPTENWKHFVPWTSIKEIMAMIRARAALKEKEA